MHIVQRYKFIYLNSGKTVLILKPINFSVSDNKSFDLRLNYL